MNWFGFYILALLNPSQAEIIQPKYVSAIQILVKEENPQLLERSRRLVQNSLDRHLVAFNFPTRISYESVRVGNELDLLFFSDSSINEEIDQLVQFFIQDVEGKARTRGRTLVFQTESLPEIQKSFLETSVDEKTRRVTRVNAKQAPLFDVVTQIQNQMNGDHFSVLGDCADLRVDFQFENGKGKTFEQLMTEVGEKNQFKVSKTKGTLIFKRTNPSEGVIFGGLPFPTVQLRPRRMEGVFYPVNSKLDFPIPRLSE